MASRLYLGKTIKVRLTVKDSAGVLFDPDKLRIAAVSPSGVEVVYDLADDPETIFSSETGIYLTYFDANEIGTWVLSCEIIMAENGVDVIDREQSTYIVYAIASESL